MEKILFSIIYSIAALFLVYTVTASMVLESFGITDLIGVLLCFQYVKWAVDSFFLKTNLKIIGVNYE